MSQFVSNAVFEVLNYMHRTWRGSCIACSKFSKERTIGMNALDAKESFPRYHRTWSRFRLGNNRDISSRLKASYELNAAGCIFLFRRFVLRILPIRSSKCTLMLTNFFTVEKNPAYMHLSPKLYPRQNPNIRCLFWDSLFSEDEENLRNECFCPIFKLKKSKFIS